MHCMYTKIKIMGVLYLLHVVRCIDKEHQEKSLARNKCIMVYRQGSRVIEG